MFRNLLVIILLLFAFGCQNGQTSASNLPGSNGGSLEIIVVAKESLWDGIAGETFRKYFTVPQPGLPQSEPIFTVRQVSPREFNSLLERSRYLVFLNSGPENLQISENRFAKPQTVISISSETPEGLAKLIRQKQAELIEMLHMREMLNVQRRISQQPQPIPETLTKHHVKMTIPRSFELETQQDNLLVFWNKTLHTDQGIIIHFEPIEENDAFLGDRIIPLRDSLTSIHVPGDNEGSYMVVEDYIPPTFTNLTIDGNFAIETRGLWRTEGDFMGGSFINYTIFDETNNQRIMLDAFIYAPDSHKRNFLLELEAILRTVEITN